MYEEIYRKIDNLSPDDYQAYKECTKAVSQFSVYEALEIHNMWCYMLEKTLSMNKLKITVFPGQVISNWLDALFLWTPEVYKCSKFPMSIPTPESGEYIDFGFIRKLDYLRHVPDKDLKTYIKTIALFETLWYYIKAEMKKTVFSKDDSFSVVLHDWPVQIDWEFYDVKFDGKNFVYDVRHQQRRLDEILSSKKYKEPDTGGRRYRLPVYEFYLGNRVDKDGYVYSSDGRILMKNRTKGKSSYRVAEGTRIIHADFIEDTALEHLTIPASVVYIEQLFNCSKLRQITIIGDGLEVIDPEVFWECKNLTSIRLPYGPLTTDRKIFSAGKIKKIYIGENMLDSTAACYEYDKPELCNMGCKVTEAISVHPDNPNCCCIRGMLYSKDKKTLLYCPNGKLTANNTAKLTIPNCTESIYTGALSGVVGLEQVVLPPSIRAVGDYTFTTVKEVICKAMTPPALGKEKCRNLTLRVPKEAVELYRKDESWSNLLGVNIIEMSATPPKRPTFEQFESNLKWSYGLGDRTRICRGKSPMPNKKRTATADSWHNRPMPNQVASLSDTRIFLTDDDMKILRKGHKPVSRYDCWFMYCDEEAIRYHKSLTGVCIFEAYYEKSRNGFTITKVFVNRDRAQYSGTNNKQDYYLFMYLLLTEIGQDGSDFWNKFAHQEYKETYN